MHGAQDAHVGAATTQVRLKLGTDLLIRWPGISLQKGLRPHHDSGYAVTALCGLLFHKGALDRCRFRRRAEPLKRRYLLAFQ